jgi:hypothetical protein
LEPTQQEKVGGLMLKLYKYVSMGAAKALLESSTIGFSKPMYFNDPFDQPKAIPVPTSNFPDALFAGIGAQGTVKPNAP